MVSKLWRPDAGVFLTSTFKTSWLLFILCIHSITKDLRVFIVPAMNKRLKSPLYSEGKVSSGYLKKIKKKIPYFENLVV